MRARAFTDLDAWKLANQLKIGVIELIRSGPAARDRDFRNQIRYVAGSAPRSIAEGFDRFLPREFAHHLRIANGSLLKLADRLQDGLERNYFSAQDAERLTLLTRRTSAAVTKLIQNVPMALPAAPEPGASPAVAPRAVSSPARMRMQARSAAARCRRRR